MLNLNNIPVPVEENFSVRIVSVNPACFHNDIPSNAGLGIDIPVNEITRAIFGNPERFENFSAGADRTFPGFEVRPKGTLIIAGNLIITTADKDRYSGWLQSEQGALGDEQRDRFVNDLKWPEDQTFVNKNVYSYPTDVTVAPLIKNAAFWEERGKQITENISYQDEDGDWQERDEKIGKLTQAHRFWFGFHVNQRNEVAVIKTAGEGCVVSPMLFLDYSLKEMLRVNRWFIDKNEIFDNAVMRQLFIYNNFTIMKPEFSVEERPFNWEWDEETQDFYESNWLTIYNTAWDIGLFNFKDLLPRITMKDSILGIQNYLNYIFFFRNDRKVDIIDRNGIPDSEVIDLDAWFVSEWNMGERKNVRLKFISEYDKNDGIQGDDWHDLNDRENDFGEPVETKENLLALINPEIGELRLVTEENRIYEWKWGVHTSENDLRYEDQEDVLRWEFVSTGPQHLMYGDADEIEEIKTPFSSLLKFDKVRRIAGLAIPTVAQRGNLSTMRSLWNDFSPRLLFNNTFTGAASDELGEYSLQWDGPNGLFEKRWKKWARFWKNRLPVEAEFDFPLNVYDYVKSNIYRKFRTRHGTFIIEEMETEFGMDKMGITKIKGYKI